MPSFTVHGAHPGRLYVIFDEAMAPNPPLTNPSNYSLQDSQGQVLPISLVDAVYAEHIRSVGLNLFPSSTLTPGVSYTLTIDSSVVTETSSSLTPQSNGFTWSPAARSVHIPAPLISGPPLSPMQPPPPGEIFFSPAYQVPGANSSVQVDEIEVCTRAFDVYRQPPTRPLAVPLFTFSPTHPPSTLNQALLVGRFDDFGEAQLNVGDFHTDATPLPVDSNAIATLSQPFDPLFVGLLNNPYWNLSSTFITANLLSGPVPSGPTTVITLEP